MKNIEVVAAIIINNEKILAVQKGKVKFDYVSYKWEFPGGKVEIGESLEQAITREILEELNIHVIPEQLLITVEHSYPDFHLVMHCFICNKIEGNMILNEHIQAVWSDITEFHHLDRAEADIPVIPAIKNYLLSKRDH